MHSGKLPFTYKAVRQLCPWICKCRPHTGSKVPLEAGGKDGELFMFVFVMCLLVFAWCQWSTVYSMSGFCKCCVFLGAIGAISGVYIYIYYYYCYCYCYYCYYSYYYYCYCYYYYSYYYYLLLLLYIYLLYSYMPCSCQGSAQMLALSLFRLTGETNR